MNIDASQAPTTSTATTEAALQSQKSRKPRKRIVAIVLTVGLTFGTVGGLCAASYWSGRNIESELRFLEPRRAPSYGEVIVAFPVEYALHSSEQNDVVFVGDSTCRCGVDPAAFKRVSGMTSCNLGSIGPVGPMGFWITAKAYLVHHPAPRLMVLNVAPVAFENGAAEIDRHMASRLPSRFEAAYGPEVPGIIPLQKSVQYFIERGAMGFYGRLRRTETGGGDVRDLPLLEYPNETFRSTMRAKLNRRGYDPMLDLHGKIVTVRGSGEPVKIHAEWDHNVRQLAETCQALGVPFLLRFAPMAADVQGQKDLSPLESWLQDLQRCYPKMSVGNPHFLWYDRNLCWDDIHVNSPGAAVYASVLAKDVAHALAAETELNRK
jgi:hypothetical protein